MKLFYTLLLIIISFAAFANDATIDSLKLEIEKHTKAKDDVKRIEAITALCNEYFNQGDYENVIKIAEPELEKLPKSLAEARKGAFLFITGRGFLRKFQVEQDFAAVNKSNNLFEKAISFLDKNTFLLAVAYSEYGLTLLIEQREAEAIPAFKKALSIFEKDGKPNNEWIRCLGNLSNTYSNSGGYEKALKYFRQSKDLAQQMNNEKSLAFTSINMGMVFLSLKDFDKALLNFQEALKLAKKLENPFLEANAYLQIGSTYLQTENKANWEKAKNALDNSTQLFTSLKDDFSLVEIQKRIGIYYSKKGDFSKALFANKKYLSFFENINDTELTADAYLMQGEYFYKLEQLDSAKTSLDKALLLAKKVSNHELIKSAYFNLADLEESVGNDKAALGFHRKFVAYKDSIYSENLSQTVGKESVTQDVEGAMNAKQEAELEAEVLASRNNLYLAIAFGLLGILLIGGYLFLQLRKTRKQLETQNIQLENQNTQLTQLNETKDRFFGIIAHDIRGPITSLDGIGEQMAYYLKKDNQKRVNLLTTKIDDTAKKLTNLLDNLLNWALLQKGTIPYHPKSLDIQEIVQENMDLYQEVAEMKGIELINDVPTNSIAFADLSAVTTIIRNLINNAVKFTPKEGKITVNITAESKKIFININDTGTGISAERLEKIFALNTERKKGTAGEKGSGLGLLLCKDLIELNKGTIQAFSALGKGSKFVFSLPTSH